MTKQKKTAWDGLETYEMEMLEFEVEWEEEGEDFVIEATEALNRLSQKSNKRGQLYRRPKRAENWS